MRSLLATLNLLLVCSGVIHSQSLSLPVSGSWINAGDIDIPGNQITVEALIYLDNTAILTNNIVSKHTGGTSVNYLLRPLTFELTTYISGNSGPTHFLQMFNPFKLTPNKWYHIAGTYDGAAVKYYVDGCLVIQQPFTGNLVQNDYKTAIGNQSSCQCEQLYGKIDEVRIWSVCRTQTEILSNILTLPNPAAQAGLEACYKFDGNLLNSQGNTAWNGTAVGTTQFSPIQADVHPFAIASVLISNTTCSQLHNGSVTVTSNTSNSQYSINGINYQAAGTFSGLNAGIYKVYVKSPEGCITDSTITVGDDHQLIPFIISASICEGGTFLGYSSAGTYVDTLHSAAGCDSVRTLNLTVKPRSFSTISQSVCQGATYLGRSSSGTYVDTLLAANGCDSLRTLHLIVKPKTLSTVTQSVCPGQSYLGYSVAGMYVDTFTAINGCDSVRTLQLITLETPVPNMGVNTELCRGDSLTLVPGNFTSYLWQDGSTANRYVVKQAGVYSVAVTNSCGTGSGQLVVTERACNIAFPNVFTPNMDGRNDFFKILNAFNIDDYYLAVYNRWGAKVFDTKAYAKGWDGTSGGKPSETGMYAWYCTYTKSGVTFHLKGTVVLLR